VVVGRETFDSVGTVEIGLGVSTTLDLWPFDDGVDVFDLVRVRWDDDRHDLDGPVNAYRRGVEPGEPLTGPRQESFGVFIFPFGVSRGKRVLSQETLP